MLFQARALLVAGLSVGIAFATPALALEPKIIKMVKIQDFTPRTYAKTLVSPHQFKCLDKLVILESRWKVEATNPDSKAFGIFQFLPDTWGNYGYTKTSNPVIQIKAGLRYIKVRYGSACKALAFHLRHGWY